MNKKIIIPIISVLIIAGIVLLVVLFGRRNKVADNPADTIGNTAGNLNNKGMFCEDDGVIFFSNVYDNHYLYRMNSDGSDVRRVMDVPVAYINCGGDYVYYYFDDQGDVKFMGIAGNMRGIYRQSKDSTEDMFCIDRTTSGIVNLIGSKLYYEHYDHENGITLYEATLDGKTKQERVRKIVNPACVVNGNIYYPDQDDNFYLNVYRPGDSSGELFVKLRMYNATAYGSDIYFMNVDDNYCLYKMNIYEGLVTKVTGERIDAFNIIDDVIFYQRNKHPALIRVNADGSDATVIAEGNYTNINCTSTYTYFMPFKDNNTMYRVPNHGSSDFTLFNPGIDEAD